MRNKKARHLRRVAQAKSIGMPNVEYDSKSGKSPVFAEATPGMFKRMMPGIPLRLVDYCTRYTYQQLKKVAA